MPSDTPSDTAPPLILSAPTGFDAGPGVGYLVEGQVAVLMLDAPPLNVIDRAMRGSIERALRAAAGDDRVRALVICGAGPCFSAGGDLQDTAVAPGDPVPHMPELWSRIEDFPKPAVAAIHGRALGGALELAMAAHYRLATPGAELCLPEVGLGLLPGAGGTQRLPRLTGAEVALRMMLSGRAVSGQEGRRTGLIDDLLQAGAPVVPQAVAYAERLIAQGAVPRPTRARTEAASDPATWLAAVTLARRELRLPDHLPAARRIIDCVEAALLLPFASGLEYEEMAFEDCRASPAGTGLRHAFFAERRTGRLRDVAAPALPTRVTVMGSGSSAAGFATALLSAGYEVQLAERGTEQLSRGLERIAILQEREVQSGKLSAERREEDWARLSGTIDEGALTSAGLLIDARAEAGEAQGIWLSALAGRLPEGAVVAMLSARPDFTGIHSPRIVGLHAYAPVQAAPLWEVAVPPGADPQAAAMLLSLAQRMGRRAIHCGTGEGLVGQRLAMALRLAADRLVELGATPYAVDAALRDYGFSHGPYQAADIEGLEIGQLRLLRIFPRVGASPLAQGLLDDGHGGARDGRGFYLYGDDRRMSPDPDMATRLAAFRARQGVTPRAVGSEEIRAFALAALINEAARLIAEGTAPGPDEIDVAMVHGHGFPRWRGGPIHAADRLGLPGLRGVLRRTGGDAGAGHWQVAPLFSDLVKNGRQFADLRRADATEPDMPTGK